MATLLPEIVPVDRSSLYYGNWRYCVKFPVKDCGVLSSYEPWRIQKDIDWRNSHRRSSIQITDQQTKILLDLAGILKNTKVKFKQSLQWDTIHIYTNDLGIVDEISTVVAPKWPITEAVVTLPKDVLLRKTVKHQYRTYLKSRQFTNTEQQDLRKYFDLHKDELALSPSLKWFLFGQQFSSYKRSWTMDYYYVDHNSQQWVTMLSLKFPGFVRKTLPFQAK